MNERACARAEFLPLMSKHILLVDDEAVICDLLGQFLSGCGYRVSSAGTAAQAQQIVRADPPQLIITDLQLEDSDGLAMVDSLKASLPDPATPVILLTGVFFDPAVFRDKLSKKVSGYVYKTAALSEIQAEVERLIGRA